LCATNSTGFFVFFAAWWIHILRCAPLRCGVLLFMICGKKRIRYLRCAFLYCGVLLHFMMCRKKGLDVWVGWESFSDIQSSLLLDCQLLRRTIYNMCTQKPPQDYSQQLYDRYRESFEEYINSMVCKEHAWFYFIFFCPFGCVIMPLETQDDDDLLFPLDLSPLKVVETSLNPFVFAEKIMNFCRFTQKP
jgi:hypothetical protein